MLTIERRSLTGLPRDVQTLRSLKANPSGPLPIEVVNTTVWLDALILRTAPAEVASPVQTNPNPTAICFSNSVSLCRKAIGMGAPCGLPFESSSITPANGVGATRGGLRVEVPGVPFPLPRVARIPASNPTNRRTLAVEMTRARRGKAVRAPGIGSVWAGRSAARSCLAKVPALAWRSPGAFAMAVRTALSTPGPSSGRIVDGAGGGSLRCAYMTAASCSLRNGTCPVSDS